MEQNEPKFIEPKTTQESRVKQKKQYFKQEIIHYFHGTFNIFIYPIFKSSRLIIIRKCNIFYKILYS